MRGKKNKHGCKKPWLIKKKVRCRIAADMKDDGCQDFILLCGPLAFLKPVADKAIAAWNAEPPPEQE